MEGIGCKFSHLRQEYISSPTLCVPMLGLISSTNSNIIGSEANRVLNIQQKPIKITSKTPMAIIK